MSYLGNNLSKQPNSLTLPSLRKKKTTVIEIQNLLNQNEFIMA